MKYFSFLNTAKKARVYLAIIISICLTRDVFAQSDIEAVLDTNNGGSAFSVQDSDSAEVFHVDSNGNVVAEGCVRIDSGGAECTDAQGLIVDGSAGIGVTTALTALHVDSNAANTTAIITIENNDGNGDIQFFVFSGTPESNVTADPGALSIDPLNGAMYLKDSGSGTNTGWILMATATSSQTAYGRNITRSYRNLKPR